jgi:NAD-reducing hydrogenase large subunit
MTGDEGDAKKRGSLGNLGNLTRPTRRIRNTDMVVMSQTITIEPVTRIEGHAKITIRLDDAGKVADARFHVAEFRGFEKFCEGRPFAEMPGLTSRICGICPVSHLLASAKTGDALLAVTIPPAAVKLRRLMSLAQIVQSHALSFFHLSAPELLLGWDTPADRRNLFGLIAAEPDVARGGIRLRQFGQEVIEALGGKKIHPAWAVPGGVRDGLSKEKADALLARLPEAIATTRVAIDRLKRVLDARPEDVEAFGNFPSLFLGLVAPDGTWEQYDGDLRLVDADGTVVADRIEPMRYAEHFAERVEPDSYLKSPYYRPRGPDRGLYRVGPLARLNICSRMGTPLADAEHRGFRSRGGPTVQSSFHYHYARLIEILGGLERIGGLLSDPELQSTDLRADAGVNRREAVGVSEAPRGTLFHHYRVDGDGKLTHVNLMIATGQNNLAMNRTVAGLARRFLDGQTITDPLVNRVEAGIRAFDPCLSCSTHALGQMALVVRLVDAAGRVVAERRRG